MAIEIRRVQELSQPDRDKVFGWGTDLFGMEPYNLSWRPKDWHILLDIEGEPVTHVGVLRHEIIVGGQPVPVGGIGGVLTVERFRNQGLAQRALQEALTFLVEEQKVNFGLLFCLPRLVPFYERLGWRTLPPPVVVDQPGGAIEFPLESMVRELTGRPWPPGRVETKSLPW